MRSVHPYVIKTADKYAKRFHDRYRHDQLREEFLSAGLAAAAKMLNRFEPDRGVKFFTFAFWQIERAIQRESELASRPFVLYEDAVPEGDFLERKSERIWWSDSEWDSLIDWLPDNLKEVVRMRYREEIGPVAIAKRMGVGHNTIRLWLRKAHKILETADFARC